MSLHPSHFIEFHGKPNRLRESSIEITNTKSSDAFVKVRTTAPKVYLGTFSFHKIVLYEFS